MYFRLQNRNDVLYDNWQLIKQNCQLMFWCQNYMECTTVLVNYTACNKSYDNLVRLNNDDASGHRKHF